MLPFLFFSSLPTMLTASKEGNDDGRKRNTFLRGKVGKYGAGLFRGGNVKGREEKGGGGGFP